MSKVVDAHLHLFRSLSDQFPRTTYPIMAEADREELAEKLLAEMANAEVDHAIVVPLSRDDEYLREVLASHPGKFVGVGVFDHLKPDSVSSLEKRLSLTNLQGLRFFGLEATYETDVRKLGCYRVLEYMAEAGMVVWFYGDLVQLAALERVMTFLPSLKVVLNHCGFLPDMHAEMRIDEHRRPHFDVELPPKDLAVVEQMAGQFSNLYVHFSGQYAFTHNEYPFTDFAEIAQRLRAAFGAERMLMASDWPWIEFEPGYAQALKLVDILLPSLTPTEREAIRGATALSLFRF
ncbi:MAG: amidohydrolase family protein [Acidimicrobiaceae bacterium]|nr:amidohydrolase family protein [Acidimicrobiaceae bacterium]